MSEIITPSKKYEDIDKVIEEIDDLHKRIERHLKEMDELQLRMQLLQHVWKKPKGGN